MRRSRAARALTIAGSDSCGGAGIQADLKTFAARGVYGTSAVTALTAQDTRAVLSVVTVRPAFVRAQIDAVLEDLGADAVKTGMLSTAGNVKVVAGAVIEHKVRRLVLDPVLVAKGGKSLLEPAAVKDLRVQLLPLAEIVTPNLAEASALAGFPVEDLAGMEEAARAIIRLGARAVVVTGGHLPGDAIDLLVVRGSRWVLRARRIRLPPAHGTGCTFSAAIAAELAKGAPLDAAVRSAKRYTLACISRARSLGRGHQVLGHFPGTLPRR